MPALRTRTGQLLGGLVLLALTLRFATLGVQSLDPDEAVTADTVRRSLGSAMSQVPHTESTPPLYFFVAWAWTKVFGVSEWGLRSLSALAGTLAVPVVYAAGAELGSRRAGLVAAALTAVSPLLIWYSQEARAYSLYMLLAAASFWLFLRARDERRWLGWWALASAAALATHYFALFTVAPEALWLLVVHRRRALLAIAPVVLTAIPVGILALYQNSHASRPWAGSLTLSDDILATGQSFLVGIRWTWLIHRPGVIVLGLLFLVMLWRARHCRQALPAAAIAAAGLLVPLLIAAVGPKYFTPGNELCVWAPLAVIAGFGANRYLAAAACLLMLAITLAGPLDPALQREDWRGLVRSLHGPRAVVVLSHQDQFPVRYYLRSEGPARPVTAISIVSHPKDTPAAFVNPPLPGTQLVGVTRKGKLGAANFRSPTPVTLPAPPYPGYDSYALYER